MPETNVANTVTILGKTNTVKAATHWKTIALNDPANAAALKINSLFVTNNSRNYYVDIDLRLGRLAPQIPGALNRDSIYTSFVNVLTVPIGATLVAISRDNPIWLQPGDFLQIVASRNYQIDAVCSYEFVSDRAVDSVYTLTPPGQVQYLHAAEAYSPTQGGGASPQSGGAHLAWTPPFDDGGVEITNYVVQMRALLSYATPSADEESDPTLPTIINGAPELWTDWLSLQKAVAVVTNLNIPNSVLTSNELPNGTLLSYTLAASTILSGSAVAGTNTATAFTVLGWQFRVAAVNPVGVGAFSQPSGLLKINLVPSLELTATAGTNRVTLQWEQPNIPSSGGHTYQIVDYNLRWSSDNGMTWRPSPAGQRLGSVTARAGALKETIVSQLQNGVYYTFSLQPIVVKDSGTNVQQEIYGPWSAPTRNVMPPGDGDGSILSDTLQVLFVRWV